MVENANLGLDPVPQDVVYLVERRTPDGMDILLIFDHCEHALKALDALIKFRGLRIPVGHKYTVARMPKNVIEFGGEIPLLLASWTRLPDVVDPTRPDDRVAKGELILH